MEDEGCVKLKWKKKGRGSVSAGEKRGNRKSKTG